jgi:hypothetical protein
MSRHFPSSFKVTRQRLSAILLGLLAIVGIGIADSRAQRTPGAICGLSPTDWCRSPPTDPWKAAKRKILTG